jgi:hypothetical protein
MYSYGKKYLLISVTECPVQYIFIISSLLQKSEVNGPTLPWSGYYWPLCVIIIIIIVAAVNIFVRDSDVTKVLLGRPWFPVSVNVVVIQICINYCSHLLSVQKFIKTELHPCLTEPFNCLQMWSSRTSYTSCSVQACSSIQSDLHFVLEYENFLNGCSPVSVFERNPIVRGSEQSLHFNIQMCVHWNERDRQTDRQVPSDVTHRSA